VLFHEKKYAEAGDVFQMTVKVSNTYPDGYYWLGRCYEATGHKEEAIIFYQRALALDKDFIEAREGIRRLK
jgi:tetratricopeptide (TPR) repeat protein